MAAVLLPEGRQQFFTTPGVPAVGYKLMTWAAGTSTPQATWADAAKVSLNTNPIILDARGEAVIFWDGAYKIQLQDPAGAPVSPPVDNVQTQQNALTATLTPAITNTIDLGSTALSWRSGYFGTNLFLGPNQAPAFDPVSGNIGFIARTAAEIAAAVVPTLYFYPPGDLRRYGINTTPGTTDMTTAITSALSVAMVAGGAVTAPPGIFLYTAQIAKSFPGAMTDISILGAGANATEFRCSAASGGLAFTWNTELNTVHIRDIAFTTSVANGGTALAFNYNSFGSASSLSDVENCVFRGSDGYNVAFYWTNGIIQNDTSALNIDNNTFFGKGTFAAGGTGCSGTGVVVQGINSSNLGILTNVTRCNFMFLHQGINYGGAVGFYQGLSVATTNFTLCDYGIVQSAGQVSDAQLAVTGSQFACNFDISLLSGIVGTNIVGNYFISQFTGDIAITIAGQYDFVIANNYFQSLSTAANVTAVSINTVAFTFSSAPATGATSGTYAAPLIYAAGQAFSIVTSLGQSLRAFFTGLGNANLSWFPAITGSPTTAATLTVGVGVVQGNVIDNYSVGINLNPNTSGVLVTANVFNTPGAVMINNQGPATVAAFLVPNSVTNNPGFLTRNTGVTGAIATGATVAHGLAVTPTIVMLTQQDGTPTAVFPSAIGATFFTINYTGGGTHAFAWQASIANVG